MSKKKPLIVLIGRPNTGKSTLFNKLISEKKAITNEKSGTTRDLIHADCEWRGKSFELIDTAGLSYKTKTEIEQNIQTQAQAAAEKADVIVLVVDVRTGPLPQEINIAQRLKKTDKPAILAINKVDGEKWRDRVLEFKKLGIENIQAVSALQGVGVGDLLDKIVVHIKDEKISEEKLAKEIIRVGIFGKPNAGKSSLLNAICGKQKALVSEIPGTTRDAVDTKIILKDCDIVLVDTAGIKRRAKIKEKIEAYSIERSLKILNEIEIAILVIDVSVSISKQDLRIASEIVKHNKGLILTINKWDIITENIKTEREELKKMEEFIKYYQYHMPFIYWTPIIFVSAKTKKNVDKIIDLIININLERKKIIPKDDLRLFLDRAIKKYPPPRIGRKKRPVIKNIIQTGTRPPLFKIKVGEKDMIKEQYIKYLEKSLRKEYGFEGTAINISINSK